MAVRKRSPTDVSMMCVCGHGQFMLWCIQIIHLQDTLKLSIVHN